MPFTLKLPHVDLRTKLPRGTVKPIKRGLDRVKIITVHHSGEQAGVPDDYYQREGETLEQAIMRWYTAQAQYHISRDWDTAVAGIQKGSGIMYHFKIDRQGILYFLRDLEEITWHARNANPIALGINLDGNMNTQLVTHKQTITLRNLLKELCTQHPEIPAAQGDVYGHQELVGEGLKIKYKNPVDFANYTSCPGVNLLSYVKEFRATGNMKRADEPLTSAADAPYTPYTGFIDLPENHPQAKLAKVFKDAGVIQGFADGTFQPDKQMTRAEVLSFVGKAFQNREKLEAGLDQLDQIG